MFGDSPWVLVGPTDTFAQFIQPADYENVLFINWGMELFAINRHGGGAMNMLFLDYSVRHMEIKELWKLNWHRGYDTQNSVATYLPSEWPEWMQRF